MYVYMYIYVYRERERERDNILLTICIKRINTNKYVTTTYNTLSLHQV